MKNKKTKTSVARKNNVKKAKPAKKASLSAKRTHTAKKPLKKPKGFDISYIQKEITGFICKRKKKITQKISKAQNILETKKNNLFKVAKKLSKRLPKNLNLGHIFGGTGALIVAFAIFLFWWNSGPINSVVVYLNTEVPIHQYFSKASTLKSLDKRIEYWSEIIKKHGGGSEFYKQIGKAPTIADNAPFVPERFNCTTYVEVVAAFSISKKPEDFYKNLISIRYKNAEPTFYNRNHFPSLDWIPNNEKSGFIKDITKLLASKADIDYKTEEKEINKLAWLNKQKAYRSIASNIQSDWEKTQDAEVNYVPAGDIEKLLPYIPNGAVINLVRKASPNYPTLISHQGFAIRIGKEVYFRHINRKGEFKTTPLLEYIKYTQSSKFNQSRPVIGLNINEFNG